MCGVVLNSCTKHQTRACDVQPSPAFSSCDVQMKVRMENAVVFVVLICEHCNLFTILVKW
jgi:hypothetical protein